MTDSLLSPIRRRMSLAKEVFERLRQVILDGSLAEGSSLPEAQTATKLGVSRVPVREALVELERHGLVEFDAHGRACVRAFTPEDVREILSLRATLQAMAARLAASKFTDEDVGRLEAILARARTTQELSAFSALDSAFHDEIVAIARHGRLSRVWSDVRSQMELWLARIHRQREDQQHDVREATLTSHREMLEVLKTRRPKQAAELMEKHCSWTEWFPES